jgi:hypothetical protein
MVEQTNKNEISARNRIQSSNGGENDEQQEHILDKQDQYLRTYL